MPPSPTPRLLAGLAATLLTVAVFSLYSLHQINGLRQLQQETIERNRRDSLQLIRIQNDLNSLGLAMRDMLEDTDGYGMQAWRAEFSRIREDLDDAVRITGQLGRRPEDQQQYLTEMLTQFWRSADQIFATAEAGQVEPARMMVVNSLQAQQAALSSTVARLLVQNNEAEELAARQIQSIYDRVERNVYLFLIAMLAGIAAIGLAVASWNRRIFDRLAALSEQKSTLARRLIGVQEEVFRSVSRELHDDFGQILTAIGAMIRRMEKRHVPPDSPLHEDVTELKQVVQETLEKTRSFSQALHPTILDDYGLERAVERYVQTFEKQTGIHVKLDKEGTAPVPDADAIHIYRVLQEALNNVAKHAKASEATVRLRLTDQRLRLEVKDNGIGIAARPAGGLGLIAMRERAELLHASLAVTRATDCGTLVTLEVPIEQ